MKTELFTAIIASIFGVVIAFIVTNLFIGDINPVSVKTIDSAVSSDLVSPDSDIFNYRALNPTVEVYIGSCTEYNDSQECIDQVTEEEYNEIIEEDVEQNSTNELDGQDFNAQDINSGNSSTDNTTNATNSNNLNSINNQGNF